jgi:hypothetical protein
VARLPLQIVLLGVIAWSTRVTTLSSRDGAAVVHR